MVAGIDVSHFQRDIDWTALAASDFRFCFIKATEGAGTVDPKFHKNWQGAKNAGLLRGAYHFFHPTSSAAAQAESFLRTLGPFQSGDLPPALDLETPAAWAGITIGARGLGYHMARDRRAPIGSYADCLSQPRVRHRSAREHRDARALSSVVRASHRCDPTEIDRTLGFLDLLAIQR